VIEGCRDLRRPLCSVFVVKRYKKIRNLFAKRKIGKKETPKNKRT